MRERYMSTSSGSIYKRILVIGKPNVGKTSFINNITGSNLKVANFSGVTTDLSYVSTKYNDYILEFIDTPGINSIDNNHDHEFINSIFNAKYDIILNVLDASKMEESLELTKAIIQKIGHDKIIIGLNLSKCARKWGVNIDINNISKQINLPVIDIENSSKQEICDRIINHSNIKHVHVFKVITDIFINKKKKHFNWTSVIDVALMNRFLGLPIFLGIMLSIFKITFSISDIVESIITHFADKISSYALSLNLYPDLHSALFDGAISGMFMVVAFLPAILCIQFFIQIFEKTGYMTRIVFMVDGIMQKFGINGKAMIPLIIGFGCSIPAYTASRIISNKIERVATMFAIGFMTCSAKFALFSMLVSVFFDSSIAHYVMLGIYIFSAILGLIVAKFVTICMRKQDDSLFIYDIPEYKVPRFKEIYRSLKMESLSFIKKAGSIIFLFSLIFWLLSHYPNTSANNDERIKGSILGSVSRVVEPIFSPLGFDWRMNISLISALSAKEMAISSMSVLYAGGDEKNIISSIRSSISLPSGIAFIVFSMIYLPCLSATAVFHRELSSKKYTIYLILVTTFMAWILSFIAKHIVELILL
jgi:ferrous iron transport protein B